MRKLVAALAAATALGGLTPLAAALTPAPAAAPPARLADGLQASLASASPADRLMVFVHGTTRQAAIDAVAEAGLLQVGEFQSVGVPVALGTVAQIEQLTGLPGITYVEENAALDPLQDTARAATRADVATTETFGDLGPFDGAGQSIAVVDGGVDGTHPMFADPETGESKVVRNFKVVCLNHLPGVSFEVLVGRDPSTCPADYTGYEDDGGAANEPFVVDVTSLNDSDTISLGGHGTHVAGIAAGNAVETTDGRKLSGVAPGAKIVALSMGLSLSIYAADASLDWIARHHTDPCGDGSCPPITVVNNSYGGGGDWDPESVTSKIQDRLIADGVTVVWANGNGDVQGNGGDGTDNLSGRDAQHQGPGVIAVANYDDADTGTRDGTLNTSSSRGMRSDPKTWPDLSAPGTNITSACRPYLSICFSGEGDLDYGTIGGTSMASPHVAGAVAVLQSAAKAKLGRWLTPAEVENILEDTAHKFTFGGDYAADPSNPDNTSSFDKGHGLLDLANAVRAVLGEAPLAAPVASGAAACAPGAPLVTDPADDATMVAVADGGSNEATLDVIAVSVKGDPAKERMIVTFSILDMREDNPSGSTGIQFEGTLGIGDESFDVTATRTASGESFTVGGEDVPGRFDSTWSQVRVAVPRAVIGNPIGSVTVKALTAGYSRRSYDPTPLGPTADEFDGSCPTTVDVGGAPQPPDGVASPGASYKWSGEPATSFTEPSGLDGTSLTLEGTHEDVRRIAVSGGSKVAFEVTCGSPSDDYDIYLEGPDGTPIGTGTDVGTSANSGCAEKIVVTNAPAGIYTARVIAFTTLSGTYDAELRVK